MSKKKNIGILGATGSIGQSTLDVVRTFPDRFKVISLTAAQNIDTLLQQIQEFKPKLVAVLKQEAAQELMTRLKGVSGAPDVFCGEEGLIKAATHEKIDFVVSAIVGSGGLLPTLAAVRAGKDIGLANKETLVMAGSLIIDEIKKNKRPIKLLPIDSEHSAIFQVLQGANIQEVSRLILTASGGPFFNYSREQLSKVSRAEALNHPTWSMGPKITIDSATLMNKGLEVIEARWLFNVNYDNIDVVIHPQSVVHSLVEFNDGSVIAQLGNPDMRLPISYALNYPDRLPSNFSRLNLTDAGELTFYKPDFDRFPCLRLAYQALEKGGSMPAVLNAANERAVEKFLAAEIGFTDIPRLIENVMKHHETISTPGLSDILEAHKWATEMVDRDV